MQCKHASNFLTPHKGSIPWKRGARTQACYLVGSRCSQLHLHLRSSAVKHRPGSHQRWCCEVTGPPAHPCAHAQALQPAHHCLHHSITTWIIRKTRKDHNFACQYNGKPSIVPGCPPFGFSSNSHELEAERSCLRHCNGLKTKSAKVCGSSCDQSGAQPNWPRC